MRKKTLIILLLFAIIGMMASRVYGFYGSGRFNVSYSTHDIDTTDIIDIVDVADTVDSVEIPDTLAMDSLQLAIARHNKAVDDSISADSLNKMRKNAIEAPIKYTAKDSLIYDATSKTAHLFGDAHVEYQIMDLKSDKIYMSLDSNLVHATPSYADSTMTELVGKPVFKMGPDTYENDTISFNIKTKKGFIKDV